MGLRIPAEIKLARKIIKKHSLQVPFDLNKLAEQYAEVIYKDIPINGVDGVSLNLKVIGKKPKIIVNSNSPSTRQLFTLAHELGHVIIPWHTGTIVDDIHNSNYKDFAYSVLEHEANLFASELLMPREWVLLNYEIHKHDIGSFHEFIVNSIGVSGQAAAISLVKNLPPGIVYIAEHKNIILYSAQTKNTNIKLPETNQQFSKNIYKHVNAHTVYKAKTITYHWFDLNAQLCIEETKDIREWRQILHDIATDINPTVGIDSFKKSVNSIISFTNGNIKLNQDSYNKESVTTACLYKFEREGYEKFIIHPDFKIFIKKRVEAFFK